ncbi:MAG: MarR family transcriptional regulator [Phreatobacter sp.]|uniref:MarR family winged helix-turn-helix transcriptional regulator n=1 Tax=Phreatobacter sp. TaxID=1966341 RepID=UPI001A44C2A3|nr:MarR family transcriptional regulator [Phreatobacter sp.]MBL8572014.1 MarR family transcriptional regulator [Phreatobacter sp.]
MSHASFAAVLHLLRAHSLLEERFAGELASIHGLALKDALLLMHLARAPLMRLSRVDLARRLNASPSTITRTCLPLEKLGLVGREDDQRDARLSYVVLTEAGRARVAEAEATLRHKSADLFSDRWNEAEIATLADLLGRLTAGQPGRLS